MLCLSSTVMFAANEHFSPVPVGQTRQYMTGLLYFNGEVQYTDRYEIVVYDQNDIIRAAKRPQYRGGNYDYYLYQIQMYGEAGYVYHFAVWDHETQDFVPGLVADFPDDPIYWGGGVNNRYGSTSNLYYINFVTPTTSLTLEIDAYTDEESNEGYYLIASPVGTVTAGSVEGLMTPMYDLYEFDQSEELEWINQRDNAEFQLKSGVGYLYANNTGTDLTFTGIVSTDNVTVTLHKTGSSSTLDGWNLIGNPFDYDYTMSGDFYVMNENRNDVDIANRNYLAPMEGAFIIADNDEDEFVFSYDGGNSVNPQPEPMIDLNISQGRSVIDRARVRFSGESTLPKLQLNPNHTKVFIPMEGKDYAVVSAGQMGEIPVNFKAEKSGTYTMSLSSQEVNFSYLHLIDNMTGKDVDLLANPTYSFNAQTTDYASRFRLVFATNNSVNSDSFGFVNNSGNFCVYGIEGEATLQVFDVLGHMLSSETFSGSIEKKVNAATGVYMMRLINGNDVKVQKVIIK